jgi:hypothetical protein
MQPTTLHDLADVRRRSVKRLFRLLATIAVLAFAVAGVQSPAYAYPTDQWPDAVARQNSATARGGVIFYNRSVRVQGRVIDNSLGNSGYSLVRFDFYANPSDERIDWKSRRAEFHSFTDFNFVQEGPPGGINMVGVTVCSTDGNCSGEQYAVRPRP